MRKLELFLKRIFDFTLGRAKRERVWEKEFLPALALAKSEIFSYGIQGEKGGKARPKNPK